MGQIKIKDHLSPAEAETGAKLGIIKFSHNSCLPKLSTRSSFLSPKSENHGRFLSLKSVYPTCTPPSWQGIDDAKYLIYSGIFGLSC